MEKNLVKGIFFILIVSGTATFMESKTQAPKITEDFSAGLAMSNSPTPRTTSAAEAITAEEGLMDAKDLENALTEVAKEIEHLGLDAQELSRLAASLSQEQFLSQLPGPLKEKYERLHLLVKRIQLAQLTKDGKSAEYFQRGSAKVPQWIQQKEKTLAKITLPSVVNNFVLQVQENKNIEDQDLEHVAQLCLKHAREESQNCLSRAVYAWLAGNHQLSEKQFQILKRYL